MTEVIAEIGINHNGDLRTALRMVQKAAEAGANFVKFQKRDIDTCYTAEELAAPCESPWGSTVEDKVRGRELGWDAFEQIDACCQEWNIGWSASCFDFASLLELERRFGDRIAFHKVPSAMALHVEFVETVAGFKRPTLVSTGLCPSLGAVLAVASRFEAAGCPFVMNVTTALYPCPVERLNLNRIPAFLSQFNPWRHCGGVGYSGHESGVLPSVLAAQLGATWIERHFTLDRTWYGGDQAASLEVEGLRRLCRDIAHLPVILGDTEVSLQGDEKNPVPNLKARSEVDV